MDAIKHIEEERKEMDGCEITNLEEQAISLVGRTIYEKLVKGYTEKQWNRDCKLLPPSIIKRLPVRFVYDNNYFNDRFQGIPIGGYTLLVERVHIKWHIINLIFISSYWRICISIKLYKRIYKIPYIFIICMEDMCSIFMNINTFNMG